MTEITQVLIQQVVSPALPTKRERAIGYLFTLLTPLCQFPKDLKIEDTLDERGLVLNVLANDKDLPLLIGRGGKIADSIRNVLHVWGSRNIASVKVFINQKNDTNTPTNKTT